MEALTTTFLVVFLAELGDKTQFLVIAFAAKYYWRHVFLGMTIGITVVHSLAVAAGSFVGHLIPEDVITGIAALLFLWFGILTLRADDEKKEAYDSRFGPIWAVAAAFIVGEMGDKTQIAAMTMAAQLGVWPLVLIGAVSGMLVADSLGLVFGTLLHKRLPTKKMQLISGSIFLIFGLYGILRMLWLYLK